MHVVISTDRIIMCSNKDQSTPVEGLYVIASDRLMCTERTIIEDVKVEKIIQLLINSKWQVTLIHNL